MICIDFDQVMQHLIRKFQKRSQFFHYFAFFLIRKAASHMIFPFLELLKIYPQQRKKSHDQKITWFLKLIFFFSEVGPFFFVAFHNVVEGGGGVYWLWSVLVTWYSRFFRCTKLVGSEVGWSLNCLFVFDVIMWFRPGGDLAYSKVINLQNFTF